MVVQRNAFRLLSQSQRAIQPLRVSPAVPRRFNSTEAAKLPGWVADNDFNREREAIKEHAAGTSCMCNIVIAIAIEIGIGIWIEIGLFPIDWRWAFANIVPSFFFFFFQLDSSLVEA